MFYENQLEGKTAEQGILGDDHPGGAAAGKSGSADAGV
jgi:hypothetical protein